MLELSSSMFDGMFTVKHGFTEYLMIGKNYIWQTRTMYLNTKWPLNGVLLYPVTHDYIIILKKTGTNDLSWKIA
jgi:hypothetical protein